MVIDEARNVKFQTLHFGDVVPMFPLQESCIPNPGKLGTLLDLCPYSPLEVDYNYKKLQIK